MEIKLEVLASTCIKQRKPWPRISWLGQEKEAVFLLDDKNINEINLLSGRTKKKIPQLHPLLKNVFVLTSSRNGAWLAGILKTGELFLWNKDRDALTTVPAIEESKEVVTAAQECSTKLYLYVSGDGKKVLFTTPTARVFLWENTACNSTSAKHPLMGQWSQVIPKSSIVLPSVEERETAVSAGFIQNEVLGDCCLCCFAFYSEEQLMLAFLEIRWQVNSFKSASSFPCRIRWAQQTCSLPSLIPLCEPLKSRGALLTEFSSDGLVLAIGVNQKDLQATQILFMNTVSFVTVSGSLKGCGSKNNKIPSKLIRSYWIADMSWTSDSLFLACMLKRGSLILMTCLGELLTLVTYGCSVEFGPAEFIPLHPLITYRSQHTLLQDSTHSHDSSASEGDLMRQRFSVTSHPTLPYLITSDGYIVTVLRFSDHFSPLTFMRSLLLDSAQRLEKLRHSLITPKSKEKKLPLQSLSSLRASLLQHHQSQSSAFSAIPKFLQEKEGITSLNGDVTGLQDCNEESDDDEQFQNHSFIFGSQKTNTCLNHEGRLEFASMFDTIHASEETEGKDNTFLELSCIQKNLIAAWRIGISRNVKERDTLLSYTIRCIVHFFSTLQYAKLDFAHLNNPGSNRTWIHCILKCFHQLLTLLSCESSHRQTLGHLTQLTLQTLKLMLAEQQDQLCSVNLLGGFSLLKMASNCLIVKNTPQYEVLSAFLDLKRNVELDSLFVPLFQAVDCSSHQNFCIFNSILKLSPPAVNLSENCEKRLTVMWRLLYKHVLWYRVQLNQQVRNSSEPVTETQLAHEEQMTEALASHIQAILQSSGARLEETLKLNSVTGEEQFLMGSYEESEEAWERALQETKRKGGKRMPYLQTRYYLAILYCHLYQYNLSEAQGLCDHLVSELLKRTEISAREGDDVPDAEQMIRDVHPETALAVIQSLGRFMAAYFTNEPLYILPPHNIDVLPPLHIRPDRCPRVVLLQHSTVTNAVRDHDLASVWTVEYALDLLLVGGLIPEAVWLTRKLGDWKMALAIGVVYNLYCQSHDGFPRSEKLELCLPLHLTPAQIFQDKLQSFLGQPANDEKPNEVDPKYKQLTDPIEEEDANVLFSSIEEILKAAVMAEADVLSDTFQLLVESAKELSRKFYALVPCGLYLPAPPLYCPQPADLSEEEYTDLPLRMERNYRQKVSGVVQRILLLFRAAHCSFPAAQWYIAQLKWARKIMQKIRQKGALPSLSALPENLLNYLKCQTTFFRPTSSGDHGVDYVLCKTIECFRELCALCWMLHVRERLSDSCRRYQAARENLEDQQECKKTEYDACVVEHCVSALEWACRMLPFARFMNVEEFVQDIILSLIGELPPTKKVAEILVNAFPNPEDVRVPLREKYNALHQRLRHCIVKGPNSEEMMSVVIQAVQKVNLKVLKRVTRNIGPHQRHIWEPLEEEMQDPGAYCCDKLSLGTSLSRSTISDLGNPQVFSDAETSDSVSEALLMDKTVYHTPSQMQEDYRELPSCAGDLSGCKRINEKLEDFCVERRGIKRENSKYFPSQHVLPLVGVWEFERDDDEYIKFLDLFLTYILERDLINCSDSAVPLLMSFSALLREHELNSLLFDVHTTLKRRQIGTKGHTVFRAGSCYTLVCEASVSKPPSLHEEKKKGCKTQTLPISFQRPTEPSAHDLETRFTARRGLFGLSQQLIYGAQDSSKESTLTPALTWCLSEQASSISQMSPVHKHIYKADQVNDIIQREEPSPELKYKFNNVARLLEWMIRWSDRRLLCDSMSTQPFMECRPMMHVKTSASAILTSLWLLEQQYCKEPEDQSACTENPQKLYVSIHSSNIRAKLERESSVDTGYSPSDETPVGPQDGKAYGEPCESAPRTVYEKQSEKKEINFQDRTEMHNSEIGRTDVDSLRDEMEEYILDNVNVTSENEEYCEDPFAASRSPAISVSIKSVQRKKEQLSSSDVECPQEELMTKTLEGEMTKLDSSTSEVVSNNIPCSSSPEPKAETPSAEISISDDHPSFTVVSSVPSSNTVGPQKEEIETREPTAQTANTSDAVRQMLQDEMFKLVQLQQINFMSLMQVVGASFANLPNMSQQLQPSQPSQLGRSQTSDISGTDANRSPPKLAADGSPKKQMPSLENTLNFNKRKASLHEKNSLHDQNHNGNVPNPLHLSDSSSLPEGPSIGTKLILPIQDLHDWVPARPLPLLSASVNVEKKPKLIPLANSRNMNGLPLLQLKPDYLHHSFNICPEKKPRAFTGPFPQPREVWGPPPPHLVKNPQASQTPECKNGTPAHLNLNDYDPEVIAQAHEQEKRWAENVNKGPPKHLRLDAYEKKENVAPPELLHAHLMADKPLAEHKIPWCKTRENFAAIPLLYFQQSKYPSALIPLKLAGKDMDLRDPLQPSGMPLLYTNLTPFIKFPTPKLIPLQKIIAFEQSRQIVYAPHVGHKDCSEQIPLLKASINPVKARQDRNSRKRQRRRADKQAKEKEEREKATVASQEDESTVLAGTAERTKDNQAGPSYDLNDAISLQAPGRAISSAGLHYLASVRKWPAELQDATTNTETVLKSHQDVQTVSEEIVSEPAKNQPIISPSASELSPSCIVQMLPPDLYLNLRFPTEATEKPLSSDIKSDLVGRKYIDVIDIDNDDLLKNLPDISKGAAKHVTAQTEKTEFPTCAKLHHMAASVTNAIPPEEFESQDDTLQTESFQIPSEGVETKMAGDRVTLSLLRDDFSTNYSAGQLAKEISRQQFSAKLREMDRQLLAIQNMAERMEKEFSDTRLVVTTDPRQDEISFFAPGVKVCKEEHYSAHVIVEDFTEEEERSLDPVSSQSNSVILQTPSVSRSALTVNPPSVKKSSSDINYTIEELDQSFSEDPLQITGLSGVTDIIADLVEEGGMSAAELGLTERQAKKISSFSSVVSGCSSKTERDKKELQTWMKRKRKERLAEYLQMLAERREKEHNPFHLRQNVQLGVTARDIKLHQKKKEEKDKALLSEHHNCRVSQALTLMHELLSDTVQLPSSEDRLLSKIRSPQDFKRPHITSAGRSSLGTYQAARNQAAAKAGLSQTTSFSSLSRDTTQRKGRISHTPYRRTGSEFYRGDMQWKSSRNRKQCSDSRLGLRSRAAAQARNSMSQERFPTTDTATQANEESEEDAVSGWSVPDEIQRILYGSCNSQLEEPLPQEDGYSIASLSNVDSVSESTSSILSKLDWNAVEAMVANMEEK